MYGFVYFQLDSLAKSHPYNPLWAQLSDLYGAIGSPLHISRTLVTGRRTELISRILYVLSYFIRCCELQEAVTRGGKEATERAYTGIFVDERADRHTLTLTESMNESILSNGTSVDTCTQSMGTSQELSNTPTVDTAHTHNTAAEPDNTPDVVNAGNHGNGGRAGLRLVCTVGGINTDCADIASIPDVVEALEELENEVFGEVAVVKEATAEEVEAVMAEVCPDLQTPGDAELPGAKVDDWFSRCPDNDLFSVPDEFMSSDLNSSDFNSINAVDIVNELGCRSPVTASSTEMSKNTEMAVDSGLGDERPDLDLGGILSMETTADMSAERNQTEAPVSSQPESEGAICRQVSKEIVEERTVVNIRKVGRISDSQVSMVTDSVRSAPYLSPKHTSMSGQERKDKLHSVSSGLTSDMTSSQEFDEYFTETVPLPDTVCVASKDHRKQVQHGRQASRGPGVNTRCLMVKFPDEMTDEMMEACSETPLPATPELQALEDSGHHSDVTDTAATPLARVSLGSRDTPTPRVSLGLSDDTVTPVTPATPVVQPQYGGTPEVSYTRHIELPLPDEDNHSVSEQIPSNDSNFGRSLLAGYSERYMADFALHGTSDPNFQARLHGDLTFALQACVLDADIREVVCVVADTDQWSVRELKCDVGAPDRVKSNEIMASRTVSDMIDSVHSLHRMKMSPEFCLMHLEDRLQEIYFNSMILADYLTGGISPNLSTPEQLARKFGFDVSDLALYMAVASTHSAHR